MDLLLFHSGISTAEPLKLAQKCFRGFPEVSPKAVFLKVKNGIGQSRLSFLTKICKNYYENVKYLDKYCSKLVKRTKNLKQRTKEAYKFAQIPRIYR